MIRFKKNRERFYYKKKHAQRFGTRVRLFSILMILFFPLYSVFANADIQYDEVNNAPRKDGIFDVSFSETSINFELPFKVSPNLIALVYDEFDQKKITYRNVKAEIVNGNEIQKTDLPDALTQNSFGFGIIYKLDEDSILLKSAQTNANDGEGIDFEERQFTGQFLYTSKINDNFKTNFGLARTNVYGELLNIPLFGFQYHESEQSLSVILPVSVNYRRKLTESLNFQFREAVEGGNYLVQESEALENRVINFSNIKSQVDLEYHLSSNFVLSFGVGYLSHRSWQIVSRGGTEIDSTQIEDSTYFSVCLCSVSDSFGNQKKPKHE